MKYMKFLIIFLASSSLLFVACDDDDDDNNNDSDVVDTDTMVPDADTSPDTDTTEEVVDPQPLGAANKPALGTQMDRVGRPAVTTALIGTFLGDEDAKNTLKNSYNTTGFADGANFVDPIEFSLGILDSLNVTCGDQTLAAATAVDDRYVGLAGLLATDALLIRSTDTACPQYLGLEAEIAGTLGVAAGEGGCGGRIPSFDVVDRSYSVLAAGALGGVGDTVDVDPDGVPSDDVFPFLLAPTN